MARFVLIDDDPLFGNIMTRFAKARGAEMDYFGSPMELESIAGVGRYDAAVVDFDLGNLTGVDVADQLPVFFGDIPMILVSNQHRDRAVPKTWPKSIKRFVPKQAGYGAIFSAAMACLPEGAPSLAQRMQQPANTGCVEAS